MMMMIECNPFCFFFVIVLILVSAQFIFWLTLCACLNTYDFNFILCLPFVIV
jgi:hypothetical protein